MSVTLEKLWKEAGFNPTPKQEAAIKQIDGPLFLSAGPGSGKTRVLLWRTLNLIVFHDIDPQEIFLSTFTEKAARQLKDGLRSLLGFASNHTNKPYDISKMAVGTVHSNCQMIITDRRFSVNNVRVHPPVIIDELDQYFKLYNNAFWTSLLVAGGFDISENGQFAHKEITQFFSGRPSGSKHVAIQECKSLFNRFSEENLDPQTVKTKEPVLRKLFLMYQAYLKDLSEKKEVDLSLLQQAAFKALTLNPKSKSIFKHIIIDEYQDTNTIQEKIFFKMAEGHKNICVVGDDDQALYRFRGATVENLVEFEKRCEENLSVKPKRIDLDINYRSRKEIVDFYGKFITKANWQKDHNKNEHYRVHDKIINANSKDAHTSVVTSDHCKSPEVYAEIASLIKKLKEDGKIEDYNQCAFLFPALKDNARVKGFMDALITEGIEVYAPRAGNFFELDEVKAMMGCILLIFDRPHYGSEVSWGIRDYRNWMEGCMQRARALLALDKQLHDFIQDKKAELSLIKSDYEKLINIVQRKKWQLKNAAQEEMIRSFVSASGISQRAIKNLTSKFFLSFMRKRMQDGKPVSLEYVINRATSLDWSVLDLFYQFCSFGHFRIMFDKAERGEDEAFVYNLSMLSGYLGNFMEKRTAIITASFLSDSKFQWTFFGSFFYALFRLGQSEHEDEEVPFPKGRIPFLTIHQSKGLEFPVVVLGSVFKQNREVDFKETVIREKITLNGLPFKNNGEPLDRMNLFDRMRMFYVALSRAQNLLILPCYKGSAHSCEPFTELLHDGTIGKIKDLKLNTLPTASVKEEDLGKTFSYTGDYLNYQRCARQYMIFRKYGFVTSRSQNQYFGSLVHQTIEDLHHRLKQIPVA